MVRLRAVVQFRGEGRNPTWDFVTICIWSVVEINAGIICVCMPSMRLLLIKLFPYLRTTTTRYYAKYSSGLHHLMAQRPTKTSAQTSKTSRALSYKSWSHGCPGVSATGVTSTTASTAEHRDEDDDKIQLACIETCVEEMRPKPTYSRARWPRQQQPAADISYGGLGLQGEEHAVVNVNYAKSRQ